MKSIKSLDTRVKINLMEGAAHQIDSTHYTVVGMPAIEPQSIVGIVLIRGDYCICPTM